MKYILITSATILLSISAQAMTLKSGQVHIFKPGQYDELTITCSDSKFKFGHGYDGDGTICDYRPYLCSKFDFDEMEQIELATFKSITLGILKKDTLVSCE